MTASYACAMSKEDNNCNSFVIDCFLDNIFQIYYTVVVGV